MSEQRIWASLHPFYEDGAILGRTVANREFIRAFFRKAEASAFFDAFHFFLPVPDDIHSLEEHLKKDFPRLHAQGKFVLRLARELPDALAHTNYYCFHLSDPFIGYAELISLRNRYSRVIFPLTAPTHSLSYSNYGERFLRHLSPGVSSRDAVVATSRCGRDIVSGMYAMLRRNYGLAENAFPAPDVPIIPLGVNPDAFPSLKDRSEAKGSLRSESRAALGIRKDQTLFLTLARISYQSKMDLLPLLQAFKRAESEGLPKGSYHFLLAGWEDEEGAFGSDIERFCANLGIAHSVVRRPDDAQRKALYAAADVFVSPVDNIQETFGLTMLEAAASSLPVIASDFDGYKDLVLNGESGILIPVLGPEDTADSNVRAAMISASEQHLRLAQQCAVDLKSLGRALARLGTDKTMRRVMGEAGQRRACGYSWRGIVERYMALWHDLNAMPLTEEEEKRLRRSAHPMQVSYDALFAGYYSATLADPAQQTRRVQWSKRGEAIYRGRDFPVLYEIIGSSLPEETLKKLLFTARKPMPLAAAREIARRLGKEHGATGDSDFLLLWALKHDLLEFADESGEA